MGLFRSGKVYVELLLRDRGFPHGFDFLRGRLRSYERQAHSVRMLIAPAGIPS
jgi:hypothetical protein